MRINSYVEAVSALKKGRPNQASRKVGNNTYLEEDIISECIHLRLHRTRIITWWADGHITVQGENWQTNTTRDRLNSFLPVGFYISTRLVTTWKDSQYNWYSNPSVGRYDRREWIVCKVGSDEFVRHYDRMDLSLWDDLVAEQQATDARRLRANEVQRPLVIAARRAARQGEKAEAEFAEAALDAMFAADEAAAAARRSEWVSQ